MAQKMKQSRRNALLAKAGEIRDGMSLDVPLESARTGPVDSVSEAVDVLLKELPRDILGRLGAMNAYELLGEHFGVGMWIRNRLIWSSRFVEETGVIHRDDVSGVILDALHERVLSDPSFADELKSGRRELERLRAFERAADETAASTLARAEETARTARSEVVRLWALGQHAEALRQGLILVDQLLSGVDPRKALTWNDQRGGCWPRGPLGETAEDVRRRLGSALGSAVRAHNLIPPFGLGARDHPDVVRATARALAEAAFGQDTAVETWWLAELDRGRSLLTVGPREGAARGEPMAVVESRAEAIEVLHGRGYATGPDDLVPPLTHSERLELTGLVDYERADRDTVASAVVLLARHGRVVSGEILTRLGEFFEADGGNELGLEDLFDPSRLPHWPEDFSGDFDEWPWSEMEVGGLDENESPSRSQLHAVAKAVVEEDAESGDQAYGRLVELGLDVWVIDVMSGGGIGTPATHDVTGPFPTREAAREALASEWIVNGRITDEHLDEMLQARG